MATIARRIERDYPQRPIDTHLPSTIPNAISGAVSSIARQLNAVVAFVWRRALVPVGSAVHAAATWAAA